MATQGVLAFWRVFDNLSMEDRAKLLMFTTGTTKVPLDGFDPLFTITKGTEKDALPRSHTCFNQLVFPPYESDEVCLSKLLLAVNNTDGFLLS